MQNLRGSVQLPKIDAVTLSRAGEALIAFDRVAGVVVVSVDGGAYGPIAGVGAAPGAPDTSVQYNNGGAFTGSADLTYDGTNLVAANTIHADGGIDRSSANPLGIGIAVASLIAIGNVGIPTFIGDVCNVAGELQADGGIDTSAPAALTIGAATASGVELGAAGIGVSSLGTFNAFSSIGLNGANGAPFIAAVDGTAAGVSSAGTGRLVYNDTTKQWEASVDGGAYAALGGAAAGSNNSVQRNSGGVLAGDSNLTYDGSHLNGTAAFYNDIGLDRQSAGSLFIGGNNANALLLSKVGTKTTVVGDLDAGTSANPSTITLYIPAANNAMRIMQTSSNQVFEFDGSASPDLVTWGNPTFTQVYNWWLANSDANAFLAQDHGGADFLRIDTTAKEIVIGDTSSDATLVLGGAGQIRFEDVSVDHNVTIAQSGAAAVGRGLTLRGGIGGDTSGAANAGNGGPSTLIGADGGDGDATFAGGSGGNGVVDAGAAGADGGGGTGANGNVLVGATNAVSTLIGRAAGNIGFFGGAGGAKPTVSGSRAANAALASLLTALAGLGLLTDSTSI